MIRVIKEILLITVLVLGVYFAYQFYETNNFNDFLKAEKNLYSSKFTRDDEVKYTDENSYKIESEEYNDAMFYQTIQVEKNTPYRVSCMVKTSDVKAENDVSGVGAQISIQTTTERSIAITGTTDWTRIELIFNSKDREEVQIGFRLGGYLGDCSGEAWFTDFKIEKGEAENDTDWSFACFIFNNVEVTLDGTQQNYSLNTTDISNIKDTIARFATSCNTLSEGKMTASYEIYEIDTPISKLSYDEEFGYYVAPEDIEEQISEIIHTNDYDHIFIIFKLDDSEVKDWVGLGAMDYYGIGFSNIRLPNEENSYIYKYDARVNRFPEEVFLHEFLHSLERTLTEYGYTIPELHDYEDYGYETQALIGLRQWYADYMNCEIETAGGYVGLDEIVYTLKPAKSSNFENAITLENPFNEPEDIFQEIMQIFNKLKENLTTIIEQT